MELDKLLGFINELATRLGQSSWDVMQYAVRYNKLDGLTSIFGWISVFLITGILIITINKKKPKNYDDSIPWEVVTIVSGLINLFIVTVMVNCIQNALIKYMEPTGYTIIHIFNQIKK